MGKPHTRTVVQIQNIKSITVPNAD